ncbi:MAG: phosphonate ABC transporter ATP-binding protein [Thermodesulfobacteriota bacterium]
MEQIRATDLSIGYGRKVVVREVDIRVGKGEFLSILGPSGAGKSTLLMSVNGTTDILGGRLEVLGKDLAAIGHADLKNLRARIGVIFQGFNLVGRLSVLDNIASGMLHRKPLLSALIKHYSRSQYEEIYEYMKLVGIEGEALSRCDRLSGGQRQRVAIARAVAQRPEIILADEPVSSLDPVSARTVLETLRNANGKYGMTVVANLHQLDYAREYCRRVIGVNDGRIVFDGPPDRLCRGTIEEIYRCDRAGGREPGLAWPIAVPAAAAFS